MAKQYGPAHQSARCTVSNHPSRPEIDRGLIDGVPLRTLAAAHGLSPSALFRHTRSNDAVAVAQPHLRYPSFIAFAINSFRLLVLKSP